MAKITLKSIEVNGAGVFSTTKVEEMTDAQQSEAARHFVPAVQNGGTHE